MRATSTEQPLAGFWMGGFEGADHVNGRGLALDMQQFGGHWQQLEADHQRAAEAGILCVRESIGWRLSEDGAGVIDLQRARRIHESARRHGLQVLWTLMHYGLPAGLSLHDDRFIPRLVRFAAEVARVIGLATETAPVFTPVNEISFLAWAAAQNGMLHPPDNTPETDDATRCARGYAVKRRLVQATLGAMDAMRAVDPRCRFLQVEPVTHVAPPLDRPDLLMEAEAVASWQWQAWDMLSGRTEPGCGGHPEALDLLGINHYHHSQWELHSGHRLDWALRDHRRRPLARLLQDVWARYQRPLLLAETSHVGCGRAHWLHETAAELRDALQAGVPVLGACLYPLVDRPDWNEPAQWHRSGLWHVDEQDPDLPRLPEPEYARALQQWQQVLPQAETPDSQNRDEPSRAQAHTSTLTQPSTPTSPCASATAQSPRPLLLVFSHLRWDFVAHRTRHLLQRLAGHWQVLLVEEPVPDCGPPRLHRLARGPFIDVLVPHLPALLVQGAPGFAPASTPLLQQLLHNGLEQPAHSPRQARQQPGPASPFVAWLTTPMALDLARAQHPQALVYDCADELVGFKGAPPELPRLEAELLRSADLVLAASAALARTRAAAAGRVVHHIANGVELETTAPLAPASAARDWAAWEAHAAQGHLPSLRVGYAGVVDERLDTALLDALAQARPQWQFIVLGPVVKIDPGSLPRRPNIHWLGEQPSATVRAFMAGWQLGLIPFVERPVSSRSNPLKALEYLAAGLPVVASPIPELIPLLPAGLVMAPDAAAFLQRCDEQLAETPAQRSQRQARAQALVASHSWDRVAEQVLGLLGPLGQPPQT